VNIFGQHSRLKAPRGWRDELVARFEEAARIQADNPACLVMFASVAPDDEETVYLTEVWASEEEHTRARESDEIQEWAKGMPELVAGPPETVRFEPVGGKGLS
jgi:quinol monooxygenase YgiN